MNDNWDIENWDCKVQWVLHEFNNNKDCPEGQETKNGSDKKTTIEGGVGKMKSHYEIIVDIRTNLSIVK